MSEAITWTNITVRLGDLQPWERNPRKSSKKQAQKMLESWDKFGQVQTVAVSPSLSVLDGHQRLSALLTVHGKGYEIDARQASRELSESEREQLVVTLHTGATGSWDWEELANWDATSLQEWGFDSDALSQWNTDAVSLALMLEVEAARELTEERRAKDAMGTLDDVDGYDFEIDSAKLGYRLEAVTHCEKKVQCLELFAGRGLLSYWYGRIFEEVIRVDSSSESNADFVMKAEKYLQDELDFSHPFDFVDFDDEGCPSECLQIFFEKIAQIRWPSFVLCLTDGAGLNLKVRGKVNLQKHYRQGDDAVVTSSTELYEAHPALVENHIKIIAEEAGYTAKRISLYRGSRGNVSYGCYKIIPNATGQSVAD